MGAQFYIIAIALALVSRRSWAANEAMAPCVFPNEKTEDDGVKKLLPIKGQGFSITDLVKGYIYDIGICKNVGKSGDTAAVLQKRNETKVIAVVGRYDVSHVISGSHWIMLQFKNGDLYPTACNSTPRAANIMFICNHNVGDLSKVRIVEENSDLNSDCYYLFEVEHCLACEEGCDSYNKKLSPGSIILISVFSIAAAYLLFGFIYQRCFKKTRGWEQLPNFHFWRDVGRLQSDGCSLVCRCDSGVGSDNVYEPAPGSDSQRAPLSADSPYRGSGSTSLLDEHEPDDHLLAA